MNTVATRTARWTPINVATVVLGFAAWWPLGIAAIAYILLGGSIDELLKNGFSQLKGISFPQRSSGNAAFDAYRAETLERLARAGRVCRLCPAPSRSPRPGGVRPVHEGAKGTFDNNGQPA